MSLFPSQPDLHLLKCLESSDIFRPCKTFFNIFKDQNRNRNQWIQKNTIISINTKTILSGGNSDNIGEIDEKVNNTRNGSTSRTNDRRKSGKYIERNRE